MSKLLYPNKYVEPGSYFKLIGNGAVSLNTIQLPIVVGKGSRFIEQEEIITRGYVFKESVVVSELYPNIFDTKFSFVKDKKQISIYKDGFKIPETSYAILDDNTIQLLEYDTNSQYSIDYQSTSRFVKDKTDLNIVSFQNVGDTHISNNFIEFKDFYLEYNLINLRLNDSPNDSVLSFYPEYLNEWDYSRIENLNVIGDIEVIARDVQRNMSVNGYVSRVELNEDNTINYIWLTLEYQLMDSDTSYITYVKVPKDNKYHYWKGVGFRVYGDNITGELITKQGKFIAEHPEVKYFLASEKGNPIFTEHNEYIALNEWNDGSYVFFDALAPKKFIRGPERTICLNVISVGSYSHTNTIDNVETKLNESSYYIDYSNVDSPKCRVSLKTDDYYIRDNVLYLVFILQDDLGNATYKEVECDIIQGNIYLKDSVRFELPSGIAVILYNNVQLLLTETDEFLLDEQERGLIVNSSSAGASTFKLKSDLLEFDYIPVDTSIPTIIDVTNTFDINKERIEITSDDYYEFNGILARVNEINKGDIIKFDVESSGYICWNLTEDVDIVNPSVMIDYSGSITGEYCGRYFKLPEVVANFEIDCDEEFDYRLITKDGVSYLVIKDDVPNLTIRYRTWTKQPNNVTSYTVRALCIRPDSLYNTVIEVSSLEEGRSLLGPFTSLNDLYIANEIAWREFDVPLRYAYLQIKDSDNDGVISEDDIKTAFNALKKFKKGTDIVLLRNQDYLEYLIDYNNSQNDPFEQNEHKIWFNSNDTDYINELSYGTYPEFKNVIGNNSARIEMTIENRTSTLNLDGSFIAWDFACIRNSLLESDSLVNRKINAFSYINVKDYSENRDLGFHNIMFVIQKNDEYRIGDDVSISEDEQTANQIVVSVKWLRERLDEEIVAKTFDTISGALQFIQSKLIENIETLIERKYISQYIENGVKRKIDPSKDITVKRLSDNQYQFGYGFYTRHSIKHVFGTYVLDRTFN